MGAKGTAADDQAPPSGRWRACAFGVPLEADFALPALPTSRDGAASVSTSLELVSVPAADQGWDTERATRVDELRRSDGRQAMAIDLDEQLGYRLLAPGFGRYRVTADGLRVRCAPVRLAAWRRERFLTARVLPLVALLRGLEVLHASAVSFGDSVVALVGPSHSGKTSLAVHMMLAGAGFVTDDVLALQVSSDGLIAHPGAAIAGVRHAEHALLSGADRDRLGPASDRGDKVWASLRREDRPLPLRAVYFLRRGADADRISIRDLDPPDPRRLLGSAFLEKAAHDSARLERLLETCASLSRTASSYNVTTPSHVGASALARTISSHASRLLDERVDAQEPDTQELREHPPDQDRGRSA